jgi:hypothetical protein
MSAIKRAPTYDPFGWRHAELADPATDPARRAELLNGLATNEAEEITRGRRHVTIIHGDPIDLAASDHLDAFYATARALADRAEWSRLAGGIDYLTVTVSGAGRDRLLHQLAAAAHEANPGGWQVVDSPCPVIA